MFKRIAVIVMIALFAISGNALAQTAIAGASVSGVNANAGASANNSQGQDQTQGQGQTQGVGIDQFNNSFNSRSDAEKIGKSFVVPGSVQFGPAINYFGKGGPTAGFQDIRTLLMYGCLFTEGALEEMSSGASTFSGRVVVRQMNTTKIVAKADEAGTRWIKIVVSDKMIDGVVPALHVTAEADSRDVDMIAIMAKSALEALRKGANVLHVTAFGAARDTETRGWGIGFNSTMAKVFQQNDDASVVGTGGFGYSSAWAGMRDKPWLQGFGLIDANLELPKIEKAAPAKVEAPKAAPAKVTAAPTPAPAVKADPAQTGNHMPKKQ